MNGKMTLTPALTLAQYQYLQAFGETRRMKRNTAAEVQGDERRDPLRIAVGLPTGFEGAYVVHGEEGRSLVTNHNSPPDEQPGLWCPLRPSKDGTTILVARGEPEDEWTAGEWLKYITHHFLVAWGISVSGRWWYTDREGTGIVIAQGSEVHLIEPKLAYTDPTTGKVVFIDDDGDDEADAEDDDD